MVYTLIVLGGYHSSCTSNVCVLNISHPTPHSSPYCPHAPTPQSPPPGEPYLSIRQRPLRPLHPPMRAQKDDQSETDNLQESWIGFSLLRFANNRDYWGSRLSVQGALRGLLPCGKKNLLYSRHYERHMWVMLLQMSFILSASSIHRVIRVILASMTIQCVNSRHRSEWEKFMTGGASI
jgi:hypothetical protein